jgi:hypothetical protein
MLISLHISFHWNFSNKLNLHFSPLREKEENAQSKFLWKVFNITLHRHIPQAGAGWVQMQMARRKPNYKRLCY